MIIIRTLISTIVLSTTITVIWGWVNTYYYHILGNNHLFTSYFRIPRVPGFWPITIWIILVNILWGVVHKGAPLWRSSLRGGSASEFRVGLGCRFAVLGPAEHSGAGSLKQRRTVFFGMIFGQGKCGIWPKNMGIWQRWGFGRWKWWCAQQQGVNQHKMEFH